MAGFTPDEAENLISKVIHQRISVDRDADLEIGLFTDAVPGETITYATLNKASGGGYAVKTLTDGSWSVVAGLSSYAQQSFVAGAGGYDNPVYGYYIATKSSGGSQRLMYVEIDAAGPFTMSENDEYRVTPNITVL